MAQHISTYRVLNQLPDLGIRYMWLSWLGWDGLNHLPEFDFRLTSSDPHAVAGSHRRSLPAAACGTLRCATRQSVTVNVSLTIGGPRRAAGDRRLPAPLLAVKPSTRHLEQVAARRREKHFGAESVRQMDSRRRKSEKSEDTLRRDNHQVVRALSLSATRRSLLVSRSITLCRVARSVISTGRRLGGLLWAGSLDHSMHSKAVEFEARRDFATELHGVDARDWFSLDPPIGCRSEVDFDCVP